VPKIGRFLKPLIDVICKRIIRPETQSVCVIHFLDFDLPADTLLNSQNYYYYCTLLKSRGVASSSCCHPKKYFQAAAYPLSPKAHGERILRMSAFGGIHYLKNRSPARVEALLKLYALLFDYLCALLMIQVRSLTNFLITWTKVRISRP
jgi:hypothetical protein